MCTLTLVLPQSYPQANLTDCIRPLAGLEQPGVKSCFMDDASLVWYAGGWYYNFSWQRRKLTLNSVSDYNPLSGYRPLPLATALSTLAMGQVDSFEVRHYNYRVCTDSGNRLRRALSGSFGAGFILSKWAVKNYYGPLPFRRISTHYRKLLVKAEEAILSPFQIVLITPDTDGENTPKSSKSLLLVDQEQNSFKCHLSPSRFRIINAAPNGNFRIHDYRNDEIHITEHCLERFASRVLEEDPARLPLANTQASLLIYLKNNKVGRSYLMGRTAFVNIAGNVFIGAVSRGKLTMITVYPETTLNIDAFQEQTANILEQSDQVLDAESPCQ